MFKALPLLDRGPALAGRWQVPKASPTQPPFCPGPSFGRRSTVRMSAQKQSLQVCSTGGVTASTSMDIWTVQKSAILFHLLGLLTGISGCLWTCELPRFTSFTRYFLSLQVVFVTTEVRNLASVVFLCNASAQDRHGERKAWHARFLNLTAPPSIALPCLQVAPWSKVGGLADVLSALPPALAARWNLAMPVSPETLAYGDRQACQRLSKLLTCLMCWYSSC